MRKNQIWVTEPHFQEVRGDARPWLMVGWKAQGRLSTHLNRTFFVICYGFGVIRWNVYSSAVFEGRWPLCTDILPIFIFTSPSTILGIRKLKTLGYPMRRPHHSAFSHFDTIPECDGQTDGWICHSICSACKSMLSRAVKTMQIRTQIRISFKNIVLSSLVDMHTYSWPQN